MDIILRAMNRRLHLCKDKKVQNQTWKIFGEQIKDKKLFLFGTGDGMEYFLRNCCHHIKIDGVVDNNKDKQGMKLGWYCAEAWHTEYENLWIQSPDILTMYCDSEVVVLLTAIYCYESILAQLEDMGISNCFILLILEANKRKHFDVDISENLAEIKSNYISWCCEQAIEKKKIVMRIGEYGGHARRITKQLINTRKDLDIVWLVQSPNVDAPKEVRLVWERNWKGYIFELETARIWLFDIQVEDYIIKRANQVYIQTKHWSSITLKKFGLWDKTFCVSPEIEKRIKMDGARTDYLFSGSEFDEKTCRSGWAFQGKAIRVGSARSDVLFDKTVRTKIRDEFHLQKDVKILLYVPTFRRKDLDNGRSTSLTLDMTSVLTAIVDKFGGDWVLFIRLHPLISFEKSGLKEERNIINAGNYADGEALVAAADAMITDYSSIMFEAAYIKQPVFLFAPDWKGFMAQDREFWLDYSTLPFPIAESNNELKQCIMRFNRQKYEANISAFLLQYGINEDGDASKRAAAFIINLLNEE